jgi:hypothetical protein
MSPTAICPLCGNAVDLTADGRLQSHQVIPQEFGGRICDGSQHSPEAVAEMAVVRDFLDALHRWRQDQAPTIADMPDGVTLEVSAGLFRRLWRSPVIAHMTGTLELGAGPLTHLMGVPVAKSADLTGDTWQIIDRERRVHART